mmetsp:Transcript_1741/g.3721  ORF Transcript_1741/g.3721 Transcript_1741/m.3721 type:complete len:420 (+) Transcript_1741:43-1302(+)
MDLLKAELERKRRAVTATSTGSDRNSKKKKYLTAAERRRLEEEEEDREEELRRERRQQRRRKKRSRQQRGEGDGSDEDDGKEEEDLTTLLTKKYDPAERKKNVQAAAAAASGKNKSQEENIGGDNVGDAKENQPGAGNGGNSIPDSLQKLSPAEVTETLRRFGLPIRLFGEQTISIEDGGYDDTVRLQRLSIATKGREAAMLGESEMDEFRLDSANRTRNVFLEKDGDNEEAGNNGKSLTKASKKEGGGTTAEMTEEELNDKPKRIYRYFKSLIRQWEEDLAQRPDAVKRTAAGKNETKTLKQCKDYIRPLFHLCRRRELEEDLQLHLFNIVTFCEQGEFVRAHDSYIDVSIGRAAWPIGVTMVGIHARSGRAKIESSNVAHVMNSELHRKYLTSVKRLMTYAQRKRTDVHPSKKVLNV